MDIRWFLLSLVFLIDNGVYGDEVKISVREGYSVTLHTDFIKQKDDLIVWSYGSENTFVARINGKASNTMFSEEERIRDRLRLNATTGDLIISDSRTSDSGVYTLKISTNGKVVYKKFILTVRGVFVDPEDVKSVSVREGHTFTLVTEVLKKECHDVIMEWRFGPENTLVAKVRINETAVTQSTDERFRTGVTMDEQSGDLIIYKTKIHHFGLYSFRININNKVSYKTFNVTLHDSRLDSSEDSRDNFRVPWLILIPVLLLICVCVCICVYVLKRRGFKKISQLLTDDRDSLKSKSTLDV